MRDSKHIFLPMKLQLFAEEPVEEVTVDPEPVVTETVEVSTEEPEEVTPNETQSELDSLKALVAQLSQQVTEFTTKPEEPAVVEEVETAKEPDPQLVAYSEALEKVVTDKLQTIPETISALMPEGLDAVGKLAWIEKAQKAVPVKEETAEPPKQIIESIGKPTPVPSDVAVDVSSLSPLQKMKLAIEEQYSKK